MEIIGGIAFVLYLIWAFRASKKLDKEIYGEPEKKVQPPITKIPEHFFDKKAASSLEQRIYIEKNSIGSDFDLAKIEQSQEASQAFNVLLDTIRGGYIIRTVSRPNSDLGKAQKTRDLLLAHLVTQGVSGDEAFKRVEFMFDFLDDHFDIMEDVANYGGHLMSKDVARGFFKGSKQENLQKVVNAMISEKTKGKKLLDFMHIMNKEFRVFIDCVK